MGESGHLEFLSGGGVTGALMREVDWAKTPVGPVSSWPQSLRTTLSILLHSRHPMFLWWGPELVQFYNDGYLPSFGTGKHPAAMGQRGADCWQEIWPIIWPQIDDVMSRGKASWNEDQLVPIFRNGRIEEVYWTYGYSPVFREDGAIGGTLVVCTETTARVLAEPRLRTVGLLGSETAAVMQPAEIFPIVSKIFEGSTADTPFLMFYSRDPASSSAKLSVSIGLEPKIEADVDAELRPILDARPGDAGPIALRDGRSVFVGEVQSGAETRHAPLAIAFGLSPKLPFDAPYRSYLQQLTDQFDQNLARIEAFRLQAASATERRNLLEQAPVAAALMTGPHHLFELANALYTQMIGRDVVGKTYLDAFPELKGTALPGILDEVYRTGVPFVTNELLVPLARDGVTEDRFFKFNLEPLRDRSTRVYGMMAVAVDITESVNGRRAVEKSNVEREHLLAELQSASRAKDEFLAMLGHELRNPLSPIVGALKLMKQRGDGRWGKPEEVIQRQVTHLVRLVDDLLDVSKVTRGKIELKKETVELSGVITRAVEMASVLLDERRHSLVMSVPARGQRWHGDPVRLAQVIANLLTNAARYTDRGGKIELRAAIDGNDLVVSVKDNGIGIAAEMLPRIFDMFVQEKRSTDRAEGGLGLGLTLVKTLVQLHGGTVVGTSPGIGKGSEFTIRLPGGSAHAAETMASAPVAKPSGAASRRVLLVDDNADAADMLGELLELEGHKVTIARDPVAALEQVAVANPEVAVLDIGLPVMDGYELATRMRAIVPSCRLIALSGYGQPNDLARSKEAGFYRHLVKPFDLAALLQLVSG